MPWVSSLSLAAVLWVTAFAGEGSCPAGAGSKCSADTSSTTATSGEARPAAKVSIQPTADILTQEIDELKGVMQICKERIELLEELDRTVKSGVNLSLPESHMRMLKEQLPLMSEVTTVDEDKAPTSSAADFLIAKAVIPQEAPASLVQFLSLRSRASPSASTQINMPTALLVAVEANSNVRLYAPTGEMVLAFSAGHDQLVTHLVVSPAQEDGLITTADAGGTIRIHKVNVRQHRVAKEKKKGNPGDEKRSQFLGTQVNVTSHFTTEMQLPAGSAKLTALGMATQQGAKFVAAGDDDGKIAIFSYNGSFVAKIDAGQGSRVEAFSSHLSNFMFHAGSEWGFINFERLQVQHANCPEFEGRVTSVVIDNQQASRAVVSDEQGATWVFNFRDKKKCKLEHRFPNGATHGQVDLASIRGFTIALERGGQGVDAAAVVAINMSHVGKSHQPSSVVWRAGRPAVRDWAVHKRHQQGDLLAFLSDDGRAVEVFDLLMQVYSPPPEKDAFGDFKMPIIGAAIVLVLGYQYMKQKANFGSGGKHGGGGKGFDSAELAALKRKLEMSKKDGGGVGAGKPRPGAGGLR